MIHQERKKPGRTTCNKTEYTHAQYSVIPTIVIVSSEQDLAHFAKENLLNT